MKDVFGYEREVRDSGEVASSEFASLTVAGKTQRLAQSVQANYQQQVQTVSELGSTSIMWVPGKAEGNINIGRLLGNNGFFDGWTGNACGRLSSIGVNVAGGKCGFTGGGSIKFSGGIATTYGFNMSVGGLQISESLSVKVSSMGAA